MAQEVYYPVPHPLFYQRRSNLINLLKDIDSYKFWEAAKKHKLLIQRSKLSKKYFLYSRAFSGVSADEPFEWVEASGKGVIYSYTTSYIPGGCELYKDKVPYIISSILLEENIRIISNIVDSEHSKVKIGMKVKVVFKKLNPAIVFPCFQLVE